MNANELNATIRLWNSSCSLRDEDLRILKKGFTFLSEFHEEDCPIFASHYRQQLEGVERMIQARKQK